MSSREQHARHQVDFYLGVLGGAIRIGDGRLARRALAEVKRATRAIRRLAHAS